MLRQAIVWILVSLIGVGASLSNVTSPRANQTYSNFNLSVAFHVGPADLTNLTVQWVNQQTSVVYQLTFPGPLDANRSYAFEVSPLDFDEFGNTTFLPRGNYTWSSVGTFYVDTQCLSPTHNYTEQCTRCIRNFASTTPPCNECSEGWFGALCNQTELECAETRCHGYGVCIGRTDGCSCDTDHFLDDCSLNQTQCAAQVCHQRGICQPSTVDECLCQNPNYNTSTGCATCRFNYNNATNCTTCLEGYFDEHCALTAVACALVRCGDRGQCSGQLEGCTCNLAYQGAECNESACIGPGVPSANGSRCICDFPNHLDPFNPRRCVLLCHPTQGVWIEGVCRCLPGFKGSRCTQTSEPLTAWQVVLTVSFSLLLVALAVCVGTETWRLCRRWHRHLPGDEDGL